MRKNEYNKILKQALSNPEVKREYAALQHESRSRKISVILSAQDIIPGAWFYVGGEDGKPQSGAFGRN